MKFEIGNEVVCKNIKCLEGNNFAPPLVFEEKYKVINIILDNKENQHLDVGLKSKLNYVTSWDTKEVLPDGDKIHWCHPSRFELVNN